MSQLYQLVYASKANVNLASTGVNLEVSRILQKSKNNNAKLGVGGVLYYADGYFFQVLEGEKQWIMPLYEKISSDTRHSNVKILIQGSIEQAQFSKWSMHFLAADSGIRQLLKDNKFNKFTPLTMPQSLVEKMITVFSNNGVYESPEAPKKGLLSKVKQLFGAH